MARLIFWLLKLGDRLPAAAIPDVVDLYTSWSLGMVGLDPLTPALLQWLYRWLREIETAQEIRDFRHWRQPFGGELDRDQIAPLEQNLRFGFLLFCNRAPALAVDYMRVVQQGQPNDRVVSNIVKSSGALAQAAPAELVDLTTRALISDDPDEDDPDESDGRHRHLTGPFGFRDHDFFPASPAQGPFLALLIHAPAHGLALVRKLVEHEVSFHSNGKARGANAIVIPFAEGDREFPWRPTYAWSREGQASNSVTSALMALEAWAHRRIESGESVEHVLADVYGPVGSPAAYLLVAVDVVLSHWPKSAEAALPLAACPELLCLDRERREHDRFEKPDFFGIKSWRNEPVGLASLATLQQRPSRKYSLETILGHYALMDQTDVRERLKELLERAAARLGPPTPQSTLADPSLMASYALNLADPNNWREVAVELKDGTQTTAHQYFSPLAEEQHFAALQREALPRTTDANIQAQLSLALDDPARSSPEFAARAVTWAQDAVANPENDDKEDGWMREQAVLTAALIAMRDGDAASRKQHEAWARGVFATALQSKEDPVHRVRPGIRYNPSAIAFVGMIYLLRDQATAGDVKVLLDVAANDNPAAAHGFVAAVKVLARIDERLPRAVLRCGLVARIEPARRWDMPEQDIAAHQERHRRQVREAVDAELAWLAGTRSEPNWPPFPTKSPVRARRGIRLDGRAQREEPSSPPPEPTDYVDHQGAALWLSGITSLLDVSQRPWLREVVRAYASWTTTANGAGLNPGDNTADRCREWNDAYFNLLAFCLPGLTLQEIDQLALDPIGSLPDEPFYDVLALFLRSVDVVYFNNHGLQEEAAIHVRAVLANRLTESRGWRWLADHPSNSIEIHIAPAVGVFLLNDYDYRTPRCYLPSGCVDRLDPLLPILQNLATLGGGCLFIALATLNLLEVSPRTQHLQFLIAAANNWLAHRQSDSDFWVDHGIGHRVCHLLKRQVPQISSLQSLYSDELLQRQIDALLPALVNIGVAEAGQLETWLTD